MSAAASAARRWSVGIDVGGTKIAAGLVDLAAGAVLARRSAPTDRSGGGEPALQAALALARELVALAAERGGAVAGIGVGVPELVDRSGEVRSNYNFAWAGQRIGARFAAIAPAVVDSDVRAAARAEARFGAGRGVGQLLYVTIGTGVSYSLCLDGEPYSGAHGYAIHFASSPLPLECRACGTLEDTIVERVASGPGLAARYEELTGEPVAGAEQVLAAAAGGRPEAVAVVATAAQLLGRAVGLLVNALDPATVIVGGGLGLAGGLYWDELVATTRHSIFAEDCRALPILRAGLGADAGIIGAAAAADTRERGRPRL